MKIKFTSSPSMSEEEKEWLKEKRDNYHEWCSVNGYKVDMYQTKEWIDFTNKMKKGKHCEYCYETKFISTHHRWYIDSVLPWDYPPEVYVILCQKHHEEVEKAIYDLGQELMLHDIQGWSVIERLGRSIRQEKFKKKKPRKKSKQPGKKKKAKKQTTTKNKVAPTLPEKKGILGRFFS